MAKGGGRGEAEKAGLRGHAIDVGPPPVSPRIRRNSGDFRPFKTWVPWLVPVFVVVNFAMFAVVMYENDCPEHSDSCLFKEFLGRFAFEDIGTNPLLGPSTLTLEKMGALEWDKVVSNHQWWRLFTCIWLHGGIVHILANMLSLLFIGIRLEHEFGFGRELSLCTHTCITNKLFGSVRDIANSSYCPFLLTTHKIILRLSSFLLLRTCLPGNTIVDTTQWGFGRGGSEGAHGYRSAHSMCENRSFIPYFWVWCHLVIGTSSPVKSFSWSLGALFGLLGAMLSELLTNWTIYANKLAALLMLLFIIAINLAVGLLPKVDQSAHIGGFVTGFLLGFMVLIRPQFAYVNRKNALGSHSSTSKWKYKIYQYVLWVTAAILVIAGFAFGLTLLSEGLNLNERCSWCHYLSCIPTQFNSCKPQPVCKEIWDDFHFNLTCSDSGKTKMYTIANPTDNVLYDLCNSLCR